jgi:glycosidase
MKYWITFLLALVMVVQASLASTGFAAIVKDTVAPTVPAKITLKTKDSANVTFFWSASRDNVKLNGYHIYRNGKRIVALHKTTSYTDRNLLANTTYQYTVRAVDSSGNMSRSSISLSAKTSPKPIPPKPIPPKPPIQEAIDTKYGVYYEIFVRAFADSNGDGVGDFNGITQKLDYLNDGNPNTTSDLGIDGIWLMPINPSPSYHGYDITDYYNVNSQYGTMADFKNLLKEAKKRGIKIVIDMVFNHTGRDHPWFQNATNNTNGQYRNWYVWANNSTNLNERSAVEGRAWHSSRYGHYLAAFWDGMPDLNLDNPAVRKEVGNIGKFWLQVGIDGFRMDAAKHIYDDFQSSKLDPQTNVKNQSMWKQFRSDIDTVNPNAYMIGEIWDSKEVIAPYLEKSFQSAFNFDLAEKIIAAADSEVATELARTLQIMNAEYRQASGGKFVDAPFLTNHDQSRVMSVLGENVDKAKMAAGMLLTLPGTPYLYYGEEVGMVGEKPDEKIRLPFPWNSQGSGDGHTRWRYDGYYSGVNKENALDSQRNDESSLFNHYRKLIHLRKKEIALHQGDIKPYPLNEFNIESYMRFSKSDKALVVHNLGDTETTISMPSAANITRFSRVIFTSNSGSTLANNKLTIPAYTTVILK